MPRRGGGGEEVDIAFCLFVSARSGQDRSEQKQHIKMCWSLFILMEEAKELRDGKGSMQYKEIHKIDCRIVMW